MAEREDLEILDLAYCLGYHKNPKIVTMGIAGEEEKTRPLRFVT